MQRKTGWILVALVSLAISVLLIPTSHADRSRTNASGVGQSTELPLFDTSLNSQRLNALLPSAQPPPQQTQLTPISAQAVRFAISDPLRDLPAANVTENTLAPQEREINEDNVAVVKQIQPTFVDKIFRDETLLNKPIESQTPSTPSLTFDGLSVIDTGNLTGFLVAPSDENLDVGPNDVVQTVNNAFRVWDKTGTPKIAPKLQSALFAKLGGQCAGADRGDPVVLYDRMADRWFLTQFAFANANAAPFHQCVAISQTGDPTGAYYTYDFITPGTNFPDYGKFGVWPDGYYFSVNQFDRSKPAGAQFNGVGNYAVDRKKMLVGDPTAAFIYFDLNLIVKPEAIFAMQPSDQDGLEAPPAGAANIFAYLISDEFEAPPHNQDGLRLFDFHADFVVPANSTFTERPESPVLVSPYDPRSPETLGFTRSECEQPAPSSVVSDSLNAIGYHLMYRMQYVNRGGVETLVSSATVNVSGVNPTSAATYQAGVRYFQLQRSSPGGPFILYDNATFAPGSGDGVNGLNRWLPSAAIDHQGNLAVSYSTSSRTQPASIWYAGRDFNALGGLAGEQHLFDGTAVQIGTSNRWGDYQSLQVDPSDDCTFWTTNQYYNTNSQFNWRTRIGRFKFPNCSAPAQGTVSGIVTSCETGLPLAGAIVTLSNGFSSTTKANGTYSFNVEPGTYSVTTTSTPDRGCTPSATSTITVTDGNTTTYNACLTGSAKPIVDTTNASAITVGGGNGNGVIDPNECNTLTVRLDNVGCGVAANITTTLSTATPGVTITQSHSPYPDIPVDGNATNLVPYSVSTAPGFVCGTPIQFTLTVNFTGGSTTNNFTVQTCTETQPAQTVNGSLDPTDPDTAAGRLGRDGVITGCGNKACPGPLGAGGRSFDTVSFVNSSATASCPTITLNSAGGANLFAGAYLNSFDPANLCTNYLGDPGSSSASASWQVTVPPGQTLVVAIMEVNAGTPATPYSVTVTGLGAAQPPGGGVCQACTITAPANITVSNDPNQCGAVVNYPPPTISGTCGIVSSIPASGSFFPVGTTTVTVSSTAGNTASFTVTVNDTQPPTIVCPANITQQTAPNATSAVVTYSAVGTDNCPGSVVTFNPASGSSFPLGTTTVTGTNTDAQGNTATCTFTVTVNQPQTVQFNAATLNAPEDSTAVNVIVNRTGGSVGAATVDYATSDGTATQKGDYTIKLGTLRFADGETSKIISIPIVDDVFVEGNENFTVTLSNPTGTGVSLGSPSTTTITITDDDVTAPTSNPIDGAEFFVRQHYLDFLNRQPDNAGLSFWTNIITSCGADANCILTKRIQVSAAFFLSIEFQDTGGFAIRTNRVGFGRKSAEAATRITYLELIRAQSDLAEGVIVGQPNALTQLETNKQAYVLALVNSSAFVTRYAAATTADTFVDALFASAGITPTAAERSDAITAYNSQGTVPLSRAAALRFISDSAKLRSAEANPSFVLMEYFGYLRRDPDEAGYQFWLAKLDAAGGDFVKSDMVKAFITSGEYRGRFGPN